jgi:hypothetical protein
MERGNTASFTIEGRNLSGATDVIFDAPGISGKVTQIADVPEQIKAPRAGEDLGAQVPLGKKQSATLEITVTNDAWPGIHRFRVKTPLGTTNTMALAIGVLPEVKQRERMPFDSASSAQLVDLPATLVGKISAPGEESRYEFHGKAGEEMVFRVMASQLGSELASTLELSDGSGQILASAGKNENQPDTALTYKLPRDGKYTLTIADRNRGGGGGYFYRLDAGPLPYIASFFPLGVRAGSASEVAVEGANLGGIRDIKINPPRSVSGWTTIPIEVGVGASRAINEPRLEVGNEPEVAEQEPNNTVAQAQAVSVPVTINGHIDSRLARVNN